MGPIGGRRYVKTVTFEAIQPKTYVKMVWWNGVCGLKILKLGARKGKSYNMLKQMDEMVQIYGQKWLNWGPDMTNHAICGSRWVHGLMMKRTNWTNYGPKKTNHAIYGQKGRMGQTWVEEMVKLGTRKGNMWRQMGAKTQDWDHKLERLGARNKIMQCVGRRAKSGKLELGKL